MSNTINSLLTRVAKSDAALAAALREQISVLARRREFGLNFEKHMPETVELHRRPVFVGDKVRFLPPRGTTEAVRRDTWVVTAVDERDGDEVATLDLVDGDETAERALSDLVAVADFRDPSIRASFRPVVSSGAMTSRTTS